MLKLFKWSQTHRAITAMYKKYIQVFMDLIVEILPQILQLQRRDNSRSSFPCPVSERFNITNIIIKNGSNWYYFVLCCSVVSSVWTLIQWHTHLIKKQSNADRKERFRWKVNFLSPAWYLHVNLFCVSFNCVGKITVILLLLNSTVKIKHSSCVYPA